MEMVDEDQLMKACDACGPEEESCNGVTIIVMVPDEELLRSCENWVSGFKTCGRKLDILYQLHSPRKNSCDGADNDCDSQ